MTASSSLSSFDLDGLGGEFGKVRDDERESLHDDRTAPISGRSYSHRHTEKVGRSAPQAIDIAGNTSDLSTRSTS
jgi:hypothetical protein